MTRAGLHLRASRDVVERLFLLLERGRWKPGVPCPSCSKPMKAVSPIDRTPVDIDLCGSCHLAWIDRHEAGAVRIMPLESLEAEEKAQKRRAVNERPMDPIAAAIGVLSGLPAVTGKPSRRGLPYVTLAIALLSLGMTILLLRDPEGTSLRFGVTPASVVATYGVTLLTHFFVHGGIPHLLGNLYFLFQFGGNIEEIFGATEYLLFLLLCSAGGVALHFFLGGDPSIPLVGASGGISGLGTYFALEFPHAKVSMFLFGLGGSREDLGVGEVRIPVGLVVLGWVVLQFLFGMIPSEGGVAYMAHFGGAAVGFAYWLLFRRSNS